MSCYAGTFYEDIRIDCVLKKSVDVFRQYKQLLNNKSCSYRQFLYSINFRKDLINQNNNK